MRKKSGLCDKNLCRIAAKKINNGAEKPRVCAPNLRALKRDYAAFLPNGVALCTGYFDVKSFTAAQKGAF